MTSDTVGERSKDQRSEEPTPASIWYATSGGPNTRWRRSKEIGLLYVV